MTYLAVTGYDKENNIEKVHVVSINQDFNVESDYGWQPLDDLARTCLAYNFTPLNFGIDRNKKVTMNCGDFKRFSKNGSAVILAELKTRGGRILGYRLLSCANNAVVNLKVAEIIQREEAYGANEHFLHNGIVRNKAVNCYPLKPFPTIVINSENKSHNMTKKADEVINNKQSVPKERVEFTQEQLNEIALCDKNGINSKFIRNPKLSPQQMRVLWVSKSKGCLSEAFANPAISTDAMKFYADRLYDKKTVSDCKEMLKHPELSVPELTELYICICEGVPYEKYIGKSAVDISVQRESAISNYWGSSKMFDTDYYEKALNVARKIKGY